MDNQLTDIETSIKQLCLDRYRTLGDFIEFANHLMSLGVTRQTYDVVNDNLTFYSTNKMLWHLSGSEIDKSISKDSFIFGESLNLDTLKNAIANIDTNTISATEFHQEVAKAGIVYVSVHLKQQKIYYLSQDGEYFLESY